MDKAQESNQVARKLLTGRINGGIMLTMTQ